MGRNDQKGSMTTRNRRVTDPYDRWCGGRELESPAYPIVPLIFFLHIREGEAWILLRYLVRSESLHRQNHD